MSDNKYDKVGTESGDYATTLNTMYRKRKKWQPVDPGHILSFMPGTVEQILVKKGDKVSKGQILMVFRAMKMNNNIAAPIDGTVGKINVAAGENLHKDTVMIELV